MTKPNDCEYKNNDDPLVCGNDRVAKSSFRAVYDKHSHYIVNAFIIVLSLAMILISVLCPFKFFFEKSAGVNFSYENSAYEIEIFPEYKSQTPWQILGALKYVSFSLED